LKLKMNLYLVMDLIMMGSAGTWKTSINQLHKIRKTGFVNHTSFLIFVS
jgi:uncharacterized membrane protein YsdA (DUF1294 family)